MSRTEAMYAHSYMYMHCHFAFISHLIRTYFCIVSPNIITPPINHTTYSSVNVTFSCIATGIPRVEVQWALNGTVLNNNDQVKFVITNNTQGSCTINNPPEQCKTVSKLEIFNVEPADNGEYTCNATNGAGNLENSANLYVNGQFITNVLV